MNDPYRQDHEKNANITLTCLRQLFVRWHRAPPRSYSLDAPESYPRHCLAQLPQRANTSVYTTEHCRKAPSPHLEWPLYYRPLSKAMPRFLLNGKMSRMLLCYFVAVTVPGVCQCHGAHAPRRRYTYLRDGSSCPLCFFAPHIFSHRPEQYHDSTIHKAFLFQHFPYITER